MLSSCCWVKVLDINARDKDGARCWWFLGRLMPVAIRIHSPHALLQAAGCQTSIFCLSMVRMQM